MWVNSYQGFAQFNKGGCFSMRQILACSVVFVKFIQHLSVYLSLLNTLANLGLILLIPREMCFTSRSGGSLSRQVYI